MNEYDALAKIIENLKQTGLDAVKSEMFRKDYVYSNSFYGSIAKQKIENEDRAVRIAGRKTRA